MRGTKVNEKIKGMSNDRSEEREEGKGKNGRIKRKGGLNF